MDTDFYVKTHESSLFFFRFEKPISKGSKTDQFSLGAWAQKMVDELEDLIFQASTSI